MQWVNRIFRHRRLEGLFDGRNEHAHHVACLAGLIVAAAIPWATPCALVAEGPMGEALPVTLDGILHSETDYTLALTPDGNTVFFDRSEGLHKTIMVAHRVGQHWSSPQVATFSGHWFDQDPVVAPDGSYLLFDSDRQIRPKGLPLTQNYFAGAKAPGANIWRVDRKGDDWGAPVWLGPTINDDVYVDFPSIALDGTLYFMRWNAGEKAMHFWRSRYVGGAYLPAEFVTLGDPAVSLHDPAIAQDQSFITFDYGKVKGGLGRLCISFRENEHWGNPIDFGDVFKKDLPWGSHLAPDGHTLYVTGHSNIWQISLGPWLTELSTKSQRSEIEARAKSAARRSLSAPHSLVFILPARILTSSGCKIVIGYRLRACQPQCNRELRIATNG